MSDPADEVGVSPGNSPLTNMLRMATTTTQVPVVFQEKKDQSQTNTHTHNKQKRFSKLSHPHIFQTKKKTPKKRTMSHLKRHPLRRDTMNRRNARRQKLILSTVMVARVIVKKELNGLNTIAVIELFARLKPLRVIGLGSAVGHRGTEIGCGANIDGKGGASGDEQGGRRIRGVN